MYRIFLLSIILSALLGCGSDKQDNNSLRPRDFAEKTEQAQYRQLIDVRSPEEFNEGHLTHAINMDWNSEAFPEMVATLDKGKPVFVYCLSGGRSAAAADMLRKDGFTKVYELEGGLMQWRASGIDAAESDAGQGMTLAGYEAMLEGELPVLVDFYADWCAPCKKMKPFLEQIAYDMEGKLRLVRIDADANPDLCRELGIAALPYLKLYKNGNEVWSRKGYINEAELRAKLQ